MFSQKMKFLQAAVFWLLLSSLNLSAKVDVKQSERGLEIRNGKLALNIVKNDSGVVLSYQLGGSLLGATTLNAALKNATLATVSAFKLGNNSPVQAAVEVEYAFANGNTVMVTYTVKDNFEYVEAESDFAQGKTLIMTTMKSEVLVLPDFLADSMVFYPESAPATILNIPVDNHLLVNLFDNGNAMLTLLWDSPKMSISETQKGNLFDSVTLSADVKTKFWIGTVAANGIWYKAAEKLNSGSFTALNWTSPFPAEWKLATFLDKGFHADTPTCESWYLIPKDSNGYIGVGIGFTNLSAWQAWSSDLGGFVYPCYLQDDKAFAKKPLLISFNKLPAFGDSPCLIYALNGNDKTSSGITMPKNALKKMLSKKTNDSIDIMSSLKNKYPATCGITEKVEKIFYRSESVKENNQIKSDFDRMNMFVLTMRERIEEYVSWQQKMQKILEEQKWINPQLNPAINELEKELAQITWAYAKAKDNMKTPSYCTTLTEKNIALIDAMLSDEEKEEQCKQIGRQIRTIGGTQDSLLGADRSIVKACRQYATIKLMTSFNTAEKELFKNFRYETGMILNNRLNMEGK